MHRTVTRFTQAILAAAVIFAIGCQSSSLPSAPLPPGTMPPPPPPTQPPTSATLTDILAMNTSLPIPALGGFSGSFQETSAVPVGTTVKLTSYLSSASAPNPLALTRHKLSANSSPAGTAAYLVSQQYSAPVNFASFPSTKWQLPGSLGQTAFELEMIDGTTGLLLDTESPTTSNAGTLTFPGTAMPLNVTKSDTYWWELVTAFPSPPPSGCSPSVVSTTVSGASQTIDQPTLCNFSGMLQISPNDAASPIPLDVDSYVPPVSGNQGPPQPPATTTGVLSITAEVIGTAVTFNPGFLNMQVHLPSTIPAGGKTFFLTACTIKATRFARGPINYLGCVDTPTVSPPLAVAGQVVSFPGMTSAITVPGSIVGGICHKICPPQTFYFYTASLYY